MRNFVADVRGFVADVRKFSADVRNFSAGVRNFAAGVRNFSAGLRDFSASLRDFTAGLRDFAADQRGFVVDLRGFVVDLRGYAADLRSMTYTLYYSINSWKRRFALKSTYLLHLDDMRWPEGRSWVSRAPASDPDGPRRAEITARRVIWAKFRYLKKPCFALGG